MEQHISLIVTILSAIVSFSFYIAARRIEDDLVSDLKEWKANINGRLDRLELTLSNRFHRLIDRNTARITNVEGRMAYFESAFEDPSYFKMVEALNEGLPALPDENIEA